jgi:hypothetical protein
MVTPYHFDHDVNFLFQVHGEKDVWLYDQDDRFVLTEDEIEAFYRGNPTAGIYRDELGDKGTRYHLSPGIAVHQPPLAPHLIRNGSSVSVSVSIYFALRSLDIRARIYQANACLRQLGMHPLSPGLSPARDWLKSATVQMISKRKPSSQSELLFSGMRRISASLRLANRVVGRSSH